MPAPDFAGSAAAFKEVFWFLSPAKYFLGFKKLNGQKRDILQGFYRFRTNPQPVAIVSVNLIVLPLPAKYFQCRFVESFIGVYAENLFFKAADAHFIKLKQKVKTIFQSAILLSLMLLMFNSCMEKQEYPDVPQLEFLQFTILEHPSGYDSVGIMLLSYTDGDGDLGLVKGDTSTFNFFVSYYRMENGELKPGTFYNPVTDQIDTINFNNRFYQLAPPGYSGWIKGEIEDTIRPLYDPRSTKAVDTIQFTAYVIDRAGNKSNTVETPLILVRNPN